MTALGSLGKAHPADPVTFDYFGEQVTANPMLTDLHYLDFMERASGMAPGDTGSLRLIKDLGRAFLAEEFDRFWALALANGQTQEDVFEVLMKVLEAATARPTESPSGSSDGQQSTAAKSVDVSSSLAERLAGRPDLQLVVQRAQEARAAQAG